MEELTIDNTPVKNEKDQEAVIEAVLFTMGGAVELKQLAVSIGQDKETAKAAVDRLMKRYKTGKQGGRKSCPARRWIIFTVQVSCRLREKQALRKFLISLKICCRG